LSFHHHAKLDKSFRMPLTAPFLSLHQPEPAVTIEPPPSSHLANETMSFLHDPSPFPVSPPLTTPSTAAMAC
jgi:hypothetical protein